MIENSLFQKVRKAPTREVATVISEEFLSQKGFMTLNHDGFDVLAVNGSGRRVFLKFWITPHKKPVPKFYIKKFDKNVQDYMTEHNITGNVEVYFISNAVLDNEAFAYYKGFARFTMKLLITADDIKEQLEKISKEQESKVPRMEQKQLAQFIIAA
ncbi:MAG: hypothetical protein ACTSUE_22455 [Promethearchaeota archaeon]